MSTSDVADVIAEAGAVGWRLSDDGGRLRVRGPGRHEGLLARLRAYKGEVLTVLAETGRRRGHERYTHLGRQVNWWEVAPDVWNCALCHPQPELEGGARDRNLETAFRPMKGPNVRRDPRDP